MLIVLPPGPEPASRAPLVVGIVNNMPPSAVRATERQFCGLLAAASKRLVVGVQFFSIARSSAAEPEDGSPGAYGDWRQLEQAGLDGLVVTGAPPPSGDLRRAPEWPRFAALIDMARERRIPTIWSCLAAHAAALHLDGIQRRALPRKLSGLVACSRTDGQDPVMRGLPSNWRAPHSRYNELPEELLIEHGYNILSSSREAGADIFAKECAVSFLFFQGHPEYEACTLLREYRRDIGEFLTGARRNYPDMPLNYFGPPAIIALDRFRERVLAAPHPNLLKDFPTATCKQGLRAPWREIAVGIWSNWIARLYLRRMSRDRWSERLPAPMMAGAGLRVALPHAPAC
jgi:homoserine O-succinyltransferase/O-acetyltransferase